MAFKYKLPLFVACGEGDNALEHLVETLTDEDKKQFASMVTGVISVSTENKRKCVQYGLAKNENIVVLPNCVDETVFYPQKGTQFKKKLGLKDNDFLILIVGGFIIRKGADRLSAAIDSLNDPGIKSVFIGKAVAGDTAMPHCSGILFQGAVAHEELPRYLNAADVFVLPTLKEGCSNAIVEALACGIPVISSDRPFNDDILNDGNSLRINPENVEALAEAIYTLRTNKRLYAEKKQYALAHSGQYAISNRARKIYGFILLLSDKISI